MAAQLESSRSEPTPLTELPTDIVLLIVHHLDAPSFLRLTRTCKGFYRADFRLEPVYWSHVTRATFRLPNQLAVELDGRLWQSLYKRLLTQTHVFTWGNNDHGALGQDEAGVGNDEPRRWPRFRGPINRHGLRNPARRTIAHRAYPSEMVGSKELGTIADMQCGGWSTTLLTSRGALYTSGTIGNGFVTGKNLQALTYPPGYPKPTERQEEAVSIRQFSAGRSHILALSDSGRIWSWYATNEPCRRITFLHVEAIETKNTSSNHEKRGIVRKVVGGWNTSSAYITGSGIILWKPHGRDSNAVQDKTADTVEIAESIQVPGTTYTRPRGQTREPDDATRELGLNVGEIINHIVLEHFVIFVTDIGKFFAARFEWDNEGNGGTCAGVVELAALSAVLDKNEKVDIQGSFRSFAAFRPGGEVITGKQDYLNACFERGSDNADIDGLKRVPALQNTGVISVAFGDHHYHALKKDGSILSFGRESQACGSLGLGGEGEAEKRLRGQYYDGQRTDVLLVQHAYTTGRQIWFDEVKRKWITYLMSGGYDPLEAQPRIRLTADPHGRAMGEVSEWIEQQGRDWDKHPDLAHINQDGLGSHFALTVAAAGWHSGAIVLVNEDLAKGVELQCIVQEAEIEEENARLSRTASADAPDDDTAHDDDTTAPPPAFAAANAPAQPRRRLFKRVSMDFSLLTLSASSSTPSTNSSTARFTILSRPFSPSSISGFLYVSRLRSITRRSAATAAGAGVQLSAAGNFSSRYTTPSEVTTAVLNYHRMARANTQPPNAQTTPQINPSEFVDPVNHGASPGPPLWYRWADHHFPRIELSDGTVLPGNVPLDQWKGGVRPEWVLDQNF